MLTQPPPITRLMEPGVDFRYADGLTAEPAAGPEILTHDRLLNRPARPIIVVMGVSGAGKTTVGRALAHRLGWTFEEGDSLHPAANIAKMNTGEPLDDADREPWLKAIGAWIDRRAAAGEGGVISCSALKQAYRRALTLGRPQVKIVFLKGDRALIAARMAVRKDHFMPPGLLGSQFAVLEPPVPDEAVLVVGIDRSLDVQVDEIIRGLGLHG
jgi:gluconokinase